MTVVARIGENGKRIWADIPYENGRGPRQAKEIPGAKSEWDKSGPKDKFLGWSYPLDIETCYALRRVFGRDLVVANNLADWARAAISKSEELEAYREGEVRNQTFDRISREAPQLYLAMKARAYQPAGISFMLAAGHAILGDEPGLGKTIQTLGALVEADSKRIIVACKKSAAYSVWEAEAHRWAPGIATFVAQGTRAEREATMGEFSDHPVNLPGTRKMLIVNVEMLRAKREEVCPEGLDPEFCNERPSQARGDHRHSYKSYPEWPFIHEQEWDAIVLDESHNVLASTANIQSKRITQGRFGVMQIRRRLREDGLAIALSGTPFRSNLTNGWGTLNWLSPKDFGSYWKWAERYFGVTEERAGYRMVKVVGDGSKAPVPTDQAAFDRMLRPYYLGRKKSEVASDLPPVIFAGTPPDDNPEGPCYVRLHMDPRQEKAYIQMRDEAEADIDGGHIMATGILAEITRRRQFSTSFWAMGDGEKILPVMPSNKMDWITDFMTERKDTDAKVVIASNFTEVVEMVATVLRKEGWDVMTLTGATSTKNRTLLQKRFQDPDDSLRVVVLNTKAGGESITLDRADEMIVIDDPWKSDTSKQLYDRIHRVSRAHQVIIYRLLSVGTVEEWMAGLSEEQRLTVENASPKRLSEMKGDMK